MVASNIECSQTVKCRLRSMIDAATRLTWEEVSKRRLTSGTGGLA